MGEPARKIVHIDRIDRTPPHSLEAEQNVIAACLIDEQAIAEAIDIIGPGDFYRTAHAVIYSAILRLFERGKGVGLTTVREELITSGVDLDTIGGYGYLVDLASSIPTTAHAKYFAGIVGDRARQRALIDAGNRIAGLGYEPGDESDPVSKALGLVLDVQADRKGETLHSAKTVAAEHYQAIGEASERGDRPDPTLVETGFPCVDEVLKMRAPDLVIVAARPAMGKTSWILNVAEHNARLGYPVLFCSLEMSRKQLIARIVAGQTGIDVQRQLSGRLHNDEWEAMRRVVDLMPENLVIDDRSGMTVAQVYAGAKRMQARGMAPHLIAVDYVQLMSADTTGRRKRGDDNRTQEVTAISKGLKGLAKDLNCVVIALSQLSREVEKRSDKRPLLSDLRESGSLEQDSDIVQFLYRHEYYYKDERPNEAELINAKFRSGSTGSVTLGFNKPRTQFYSHHGRGFGGAL